MNSVHLVGNLGADPSARVSPNGATVLKLRVATTERVKKGEEFVDHTEWHSVVTFGKRAEALAKFLAKGHRVAVSGRLRTSSYEKDGVKHYSTEIIADDVESLTPKDKSSSPKAAEAESSEEPNGQDIPF